jgi:general secretion pathway protein M
MSEASLAPSETRPRRPWLALLIYLALLVGLTAAAAALIANLLDSYAALDGSRETLARLDRQLRRAIPRQDPAGAAVNGPPFLTGKTITIAGAALQERVETAVKNAGGAVLSSQIELQGPHAAEGFVGLTESLEIDQAALQTLLYDLEAGMPFLFVENLAIQAPQAFGEAEGAPMRVLVGVSGQWRESQ